MSTLIPYATSELAPFAQQAGYQIGQALGGAALRGVKRMAHKRTTQGRRKVKRESRNMQQLGRTPGHQEAKRNNKESPPTVIANKELQIQALIDVEKDVAGSEVITKRQRDTIVHLGTKVCFSLKNIRQETVFLNWAIVTPKAVNSVSSTDLLRGDSLERYLPIGTSNTFMDLRCAPINTDRYNVHMHKRLTIKPDMERPTGVLEQKKGRDLILIEKYIKTNRQVFFNGDTSTPLTNMYMVWWVDYYGSPTGSKTNSAEVSWKLINFFKEV